MAPQLRARKVTTGSQWRLKHGLEPRGRKVGGNIPMVLQQELDRLILTHVRGQSDVTERAEVVTADHVESRRFNMEVDHE